MEGKFNYDLGSVDDFIKLTENHLSQLDEDKTSKRQDFRLYIDTLNLFLSICKELKYQT